MATTYILYSATKDKYYIGSTADDMQDRLRRHNSNHRGFTGSANDWEIVYTEDYPTKEEAYQRERQLKGWKSRKRIKQLIARGSEHPDS